MTFIAPPPLPDIVLDPLVRLALSEDLGRAGDLTLDDLTVSNGKNFVLAGLGTQQDYFDELDEFYSIDEDSLTTPTPTPTSPTNIDYHNPTEMVFNMFGKKSTAAELKATSKFVSGEGLLTYRHLMEPTPKPTHM